MLTRLTVLLLLSFYNFRNSNEHEITINVPIVDTSTMMENAESIEYPGKAVVALATDSEIMKKSGKILMNANLGYEYGFKDINGKDPTNMRQVNSLLKMNPKTRWLSYFVPNFVSIPKWMIASAGNKF